MGPIRKVVIPAAGFGTRFLPVTKTIPKEMLPVAAKPVIQYVVEAAVASGIEEVILVTSANKRSLEDFFDSNFELERTLERTGKAAMLRSVREVTNMAHVVYVRQHEPLGNGHAVLVAKHAVGDEPFLVLWGDDILLGEPPVPRQLIDAAARLDGPVVGARRVAPEDWEKYGMLEVEKLNGVQRAARALSVVEKPARAQSPSDLAQIGGFVLTPDIFGLLESTEVGPSGEIYLADALVRLMQTRRVYSYEFTGARYDAGNKLEYLKANVDLALRDPDLGPAVRSYVKTLAGGFDDITTPMH
ncbi:MAG: UTP--glucose-1-phosphate uridylyltransferase [Chloroflexota bacterium]|nr:MAG: UTP--glucose-1-phosphate uridylyltransferase [Chloroflexota bacterium]